ncbi:MAG TPA: CHRD domain-containing protein, partial [bacterium]|nr:CHRD domain-containing protein [bacterium]
MLRTIATSLLIPVLLHAQEYYAARLDGAQEVPPSPSPGAGWAVIRRDPGTNVVHVFLRHDGLTGAATAAHLHLGSVGANGPVVFSLAAGGGNTFVGNAVVGAAVGSALAAGGTYLNVHTAGQPAGEIRGQVVAPKAVRFVGELAGGQEVPPVATAAAGEFTALLYQPENRLVYSLATSGLGAITAAHLHRGPMGNNGPVVQALNGFDVASGSYCGVSAPLAPVDVAALLAGDAYFNVHTAAHPGGELRGQLRLDEDRFAAALEGSQAVPPNGSPAVGGARAVRNPDGTLTVTGAFSPLVGTVTAAHVHSAAPGISGPIVIGLAVTGNRFGVTFAPGPAQYADLQAGNWYVNVHSTAFPGGELRGQLAPVPLASTFGHGCTGSNGIAPMAVARPFATLGSSVALELVGALPSTIALLA